MELSFRTPEEIQALIRDAASLSPEEGSALRERAGDLVLPFTQCLAASQKADGEISLPEEAEESWNAVQALFSLPVFTDSQPEDYPEERIYWWTVTLRAIPFARFAEGLRTPVVVSLTSYPARIRCVPQVIGSLRAQTMPARRVLLYLADSQFPGLEKDLPEELLALAREGQCEIRWCEDLKPHKKYFEAFRQERKGVVITADDDLLLPEDLCELLFLSWLRHPRAVSAARAHLMAFDGQGQVLPYEDWIKQTDAVLDQPCMQLVATGGAGALYPPALFREGVLDPEGIRETCLNADDLWLKAWETVSDLPVVLACRYRRMRLLEEAQESALWASNREENDEQLRKIEAWVDRKIGSGVLRKKLPGGDMPQTGAEALCRHANHRIETLQGEIREKGGKIRAGNARIRELSTALKAEKAERQRLENELTLLKNSRAYRLGSALLKPVKKAAGWFRK